MYCDHCGAPLQAGTVFCTSCGNSMTTRNTIKKEGSAVAFVLILLLWLLPLLLDSVGFIQQLTHIYQMSGGLHFEIAIQDLRTEFMNRILLPNAGCLLLAVILVLCRAINIQKIGWRQLVTAVFLAVLCSEGLGALGSLSIQKLGMDALTAYSMARSVVNVFTLPHLWRWIVLLVFLIAVSHDSFPAGVVFSVCTAGLAIWSIASLNQVDKIMEAYASDTDIYDLALRNTHLALIVFSINRMVMVFISLLSGKQILRNGVAGVCAVIKITGTVLFLYVFVFGLGLGLTGALFVEPLVSLLLGGIGLTCLIAHKKKNRAAA